MAYRAFDEWPVASSVNPAAATIAVTPVADSIVAVPRADSTDGIRGAAAVSFAGAIARVADSKVGPFDALEWRVIALAANDTGWSIRPRTRFVRFVERLFGLHPSNGLADPRLEALRRFAVIARIRHGVLPQSETDAFVEAGFSADAAQRLAYLMS